MISCAEEKPVKEKKRFIPEQKQKENKPEQVFIENETDPNIYKVTLEQFEKYGMKLAMAGINTINKHITASGYIDVPLENKAEVRSYIGGYLRSSPLLPGDYVKKGQLLMSLENLEYIQLQQDYLQARNEMVYLKTVYERKKALAEEQITSLSNKQEAESEYNIALANYEGLRKMLQLINISPDNIKAEEISSSINLYSPINGYITKVKAVKGMFAEPTDVIFEIIDTEHLHIELKVYEKDILKVKKGQKISFRIPEANSESYSGEVFQVGKTIEASDRTVVVHCHINNDEKLPVVVGMYVEAEIYFDSQELFCIPFNAFIREDTKYFVYVNKPFDGDEYYFEKTQVEVGQQFEDCIEITGKSQQLLDGKTVLIEGAYDL